MIETAALAAVILAAGLAGIKWGQRRRLSQSMQRHPSRRAR